MSDTAHKMMHQDQSSCPVLKGAGRKTSSGAGKTPNHHPRNHFFHRIIRSAVSTMFVLALLCQTAQSAAEPTFNRVECMGRIRRFKKIERILTNLVKREGEDWDSCHEVIKDVCEYEKWDSDMQGAYLAVRKSVEAVINEYIKCGWHRPLVDAIKNDVIDFTSKPRTYNENHEVLTFSEIEPLRQKVESHLANFEAAERKAAEMAAEQDAAKQEAERLRAAEEDAAKQEAERLRAAEEDAAKQEAEARTEFVDAMNFIAQPLLDLPSQKQSTKNLGRVLVKYPFDADNNHKGFLTAFKLTNDTHAELVKAWGIYKRYKERKYTQNFKETGIESKREEVAIPREIAEREQEKKIVIPDFLSTDENGLLLQFDDAENGDHYIISNIRGLNDFGLNDFGSKGKQTKKWIQQVFKATGQLRFYKYTEIDPLRPEVVFEKVTTGRFFQFMISTQKQLNKKDETGAAKEFNITQDGGAEKVSKFIKAALRSSSSEE